MYVQW